MSFTNMQNGAFFFGLMVKLSSDAQHFNVFKALKGKTSIITIDLVIDAVHFEAVNIHRIEV